MPQIPKVSARGKKNAALARVLNAVIGSTNRLETIRVQPTAGGEPSFKVAAGNIVLELPPSAFGASAGAPPWQPQFPVPYVGPGDPPTNQGLKFMIQPGTIGGILPANWQAEFLAPGSGDATPFFVWLVVAWSGSAVTSAAIATGSALPTPPVVASDGTPPATLYVPLCAVFATATALDRYIPFADDSLSVIQAVTAVSCGSATYTLTVVPAS